MTLDVTWDGVILAKGAQARAQDGGWFVELEQPMPVGTVLQLAGDTQGTMRVARVHEGLGAGMLLKQADARQSTADSAKPEPKVDAKAEVEKTEAETPEGENGKKERRKKPPRKG
jgi:hypothetical protein